MPIEKAPQFFACCKAEIRSFVSPDWLITITPGLIGDKSFWLNSLASIAITVSKICRALKNGSTDCAAK
jgi:hypothetical protein